MNSQLNQQINTDSLNAMPEEVRTQIIEDDLASARKKVEIAEAMQTMMQTKEFQTVFTDYLLSTEIVRLAALRLDPTLIDSQRLDIENQLVTLGSLSGQFVAILSLGTKAKDQVAQDEMLLSMSPEEIADAIEKEAQEEAGLEGLSNYQTD